MISGKEAIIIDEQEAEALLRALGCELGKIISRDEIERLTKTGAWNVVDAIRYEIRRRRDAETDVP